MEALQRPISIKVFEAMSLLALLGGVLHAFFVSTYLHVYTTEPTGIIIIMTTLATLGLVLLISRGRSIAAKWVLLLLLIVGLPAFVEAVAQTPGVPLMVLALTAIQYVAAGILFLPSARLWLEKARPYPGR